MAPSAPQYRLWGVWLCVSMALWCMYVNVERMYMVVYKAPLYLYTNLTPTFIYFLVRVVIEEEVKNMKQNRTKMASAMLLKLKAMRDMNLAKMEVA